MARFDKLSTSEAKTKPPLLLLLSRRLIKERVSSIAIKEMEIAIKEPRTGARRVVGFQPCEPMNVSLVVGVQIR